MVKKEEKIKEVKGKLKKMFNTIIKRNFLAGIATVFPLFLTILIIVFLFKYVDNVIGGPINSFLINTLGFKIPGLGLLLLALIITFAGFLSRHWFGRWLFPKIDKTLKKAPLIAGIYPSAKQLSEFLLGNNQKGKFKEVVLVQYPEKGSYSLGFITNKDLYNLDEKAGEQLVCVFVPFAPVPFSGLILLMSRDKVKPVDIPVDRAIKFIISGGVVYPSEKGRQFSSSLPDKTVV